MPESYPFEKFTEDAMRALICAQQEAEDAAMGHLGTEHLLLGLLRVGGGSAFRALQTLGIDEMKLRTDISRLQEARPQSGLTLREDVQRAIEHALAESVRRGEGAVRTGHILAGIASVEDSAGAMVLKRQWCEPAAVIAAVDRELRLE